MDVNYVMSSFNYYLEKMIMIFSFQLKEKGLFFILINVFK